MRQASKLQSDLEEAFEEGSIITERPDKKVLTEKEEAEYLKESRDWIYGYEQFQTSPTTFAPTSSIPVPVDFLLGPGDKINIQYYGNENILSKEFISRSGELNLPRLGPVTLAGLTFSEAQDLVENKVSTELIGTSVALRISNTFIS